MNIVRILAVASIAIGFAACAHAQANRQTYRDSMGRNQGSATPDRYGTTPYRDAMGRVTGTSTKDGSGRVTYRDAQGRVIGTKK